MFNERLKAIREEMGMTQAAFSAVGGVQVRAQINYEKGERKPDIEYLANLAKIGVDVQYIITGIKFDNTLAPHEEALLIALRESKPSLQMMAIASAHAVLESGKAQESRTITNNGQYTEKGNITGNLESQKNKNDA